MFCRWRKSQILAELSSDAVAMWNPFAEKSTPAEKYDYERSNMNGEVTPRFNGPETNQYPRTIAQVQESGWDRLNSLILQNTLSRGTPVIL